MLNNNSATIVGFMPANFDQTEGQPSVYDVIFLGETDDPAVPETLYDGYHY